MGKRGRRILRACQSTPHYDLLSPQALVNNPTAFHLVLTALVPHGRTDDGVGVGLRGGRADERAGVAGPVRRRLRRAARRRPPPPPPRPPALRGAPAGREREAHAEAAGPPRGRRQRRRLHARPAEPVRPPGHLGRGRGRRRGRRRRLHPAVLPAVAAAAPGLEAVRWDCLMPPRWLGALRRDIRSALARTLQTAPFGRLAALSLYLEDGDPLDERADPGRFCRGDEPDALSLGLRRLLQLPTLAKVELTGFWALAPAVALGGPGGFGPALQSVTIEAAGTTPDGRWLSTGDDDAGDDDQPDADSDASEAAFDSADSDTSDFAPERAWDRENGDYPQFAFRTRPDDALLVPYLLPLIRAASAAPALQSLLYIFKLPTQLELEYYPAGMETASARRRGLVGKDDISRPRWLLTMESVDDEWTVPAELMRAMEEGGASVSLSGVSAHS